LCRNSRAELIAEAIELKRQIDWFQRHLFGAKSERRLFELASQQLALGEAIRSLDAIVPATIEVRPHRRRTARREESDVPPLRFDESVPVEEIVIGEAKDPAEYALVDTKITDRLAQRPASFVVLRYMRRVYKRKSDGEFFCPPAPPAVLERSCADVSFLAGLLIDKFVFHLPLYRQHQRLEAAGIHLSRGTLTNLVHRTGDLLEPVYAALLRSILASKVLAMDETPIKAGRIMRAPPHRGAMKRAYFWPLYGDQDEIAFPFSTTRGSIVIKEILKDFSGVLQTDGYEPYESYTAKTAAIEHAQCWAHTRRHFEEAESADPHRAAIMLRMIAELYAAEAGLKAKGLADEKALIYRAEHAKPVVDGIFAWLEATAANEALLPTNPFSKAMHYALSRKTALQVFLKNPDVAVDTNHLERGIRPIAMGRKNWLFCWTEVGAKHVGIIQSLLGTCRIQGVEPYTYLVDVLQRIDQHPAKEVQLLMPRLWKDHFAADPLRSDLDRIAERQARRAAHQDSVS
jgi:transposase